MIKNKKNAIIGILNKQIKGLKMLNLIQYIRHQNHFRSYTEEAMIPEPEKLSDIDIESLSESLSRDLSPENLYCDGEISNEEAEEKENYLNAVHDELENVVGYSIELMY